MRLRTEAAGLQIGLERCGSGPPVALVHGFVGDGPATFERVAADLAADHTVLVPDLPGAGTSDAPPDGSSLEDYADVLAGTLRAEGIEGAVVVGLSFGGAVAIALADRHPGLVRALVLAGAYAGWAGSLPPGEVRRREQLSVRVAGAAPEDRVASLAPSMFSPGADPDLVAAFLDSIRCLRPEGFLAMTAAVAAGDLRDALARIAVPTLVLHAEHDARSGRDVAEALHAGIRGSRLVVIPDAGHVSPVEAPAAFAGAVRQLLAQLEW
jgi:pimeloyl-ACP methyl ester carboxylesterase